LNCENYVFDMDDLYGKFQVTKLCLRYGEDQGLVWIVCNYISTFNNTCQ